MAIAKAITAIDAKDFLTRIGNGRKNKKYRANEVIFTQGDNANAVYYLQKGKAKITVTSESGKEAVLAILGPNDFSAKVA